MPDLSPTAEARRRFLGRLGATLVAGLGLGALAGSPAAAGVRQRVAAAPSAAEVERNSLNCATYCYKYSCPGGCASGRNLFRCVGCGETWYYCLQHSCSNFCYSQTMC